MPCGIWQKICQKMKIFYFSLIKWLAQWRTNILFISNKVVPQKNGKLLFFFLTRRTTLNVGEDDGLSRPKQPMTIKAQGSCFLNSRCHTHWYAPLRHNGHPVKWLMMHLLKIYCRMYQLDSHHKRDLKSSNVFIISNVSIIAAFAIMFCDYLKKNHQNYSFRNSG